MLKHNVLLTVTSLLSIVLFSLHITDDIVRGFDAWGSQSMFGVLILVVWLFGTLVLAEKRSGLIIMIIGGLGGAAMPIVHSGAGAVAKSSGGFFFIWTLFALGATGALSVILAARGPWRRRSTSSTVATQLAPEERGSR